MKDSKEFLNSFIELLSKIKFKKVQESWIAKLFKRIEPTLDEATKEYRQLLREKPLLDDNDVRRIAELEELYLLFFRLTDELSEHARSIALHLPVKQIAEIVHVSTNFTIIAKALSVALMAFSSIFYAGNLKLIETISQFVMDIINLCTHMNLYNEIGFKLVDYFHDDPKYEDYISHVDTKSRPALTKSYKPSLHFEFFLKSSGKETTTEPSNGSYVVNVEQIPDKYQNMTPFWIAKKLVEDERLPLKEDNPIFKALVHRVRLALAIPRYEDRLAIVSAILFAQACYCKNIFPLKCKTKASFFF